MKLRIRLERSGKVLDRRVLFMDIGPWRLLAMRGFYKFWRLDNEIARQIAEIETRMRDHRASYFKDDYSQRQYRNLLRLWKEMNEDRAPDARDIFE